MPFGALPVWHIAGSFEPVVGAGPGYTPSSSQGSRFSGVLHLLVPLTFLISKGQPSRPAKLHSPPGPGSHPGRLGLLQVGGELYFRTPGPPSCSCKRH